MTSDWRRQSSRGKIGDVPEKSKILSGKEFLLEVENRQSRMQIAESIVANGGTIIDSFGEKPPLVVISDHHLAQKLERDADSYSRNERALKSLPALLREAVRRKVKIRTPDTFLSSMVSYAKRNGKASSATNSNSTMRGKPSLSREKSAPGERSTRIQPVPRTSRFKSDQTGVVHHQKTFEEKKAFLRIDLPGKRPEVRHVDRALFGTLHGGMDAGHSVFKHADASLVEKRQREFEQFQKGTFEPTKKNFKLDERDNYCQFCQRTIVGDRNIHERSDEHRQKTKSQGLAPTLERIVLSAKLRADQHANAERRKREVQRERLRMADDSRRGRVEYEYGENEMRANWAQFARKPTE